jgi:F0F1-type ATP synthase membrane subunit c/vacuolar-type H+-ATPase subunit K
MNTLKIYARQPSTWLGLAKLGAALGLYSTGVGGAIGTAVIGVFGLDDVIRNEKGQQPLSK